MNTEVFEITYILSEGNPGAMTLVSELLKTHDGCKILKVCDQLDIRGGKLYMLYNDCCNKNMEKFNTTVLFLENRISFGFLSKKEVHKNLERVRAIPFIKSMPENFLETYASTDKWNRYCFEQEQYFKKHNNA